MDRRHPRFVSKAKAIRIVWPLVLVLALEVTLCVWALSTKPDMGDQTVADAQP